MAPDSCRPRLACLPCLAGASSLHPQLHELANAAGSPGGSQRDSSRLRGCLVRPGPQHLPAPTPGRLCFSKPPHLGRVAFSCPWLFRLSRWKVVSWKRPRVTAVNTGYLSLGLCKDRRDPSRACHEFWPRTPALLERGAGRAILSARASVAAHPRRGCSRADGLGLSADHSLACALGRVIPPQSASDPDDPG